MENASQDVGMCENNCLLGLFSASAFTAALRGTEPELLLWEMMQHKSVPAVLGVYPFKSSGSPERELLMALQW